MTAITTEALRAILETIHRPGTLDDHPWASCRFVQETVSRRPELARQSPGNQLSSALAEFFTNTIPANPPRRGKRLDTRWGEFGLLAAQYFAPLQFGAPIPGSLREAWGRIDHAILLYKFGRGAEALSQQDVETYKLVGNEREIAPASTLSDWHTKGIQKLAEALAAREAFLEREQKRPPRRIGRILLLFILLLLASFITWGGFKARRIYQQAQIVWQDAASLQAQAARSPSLETIQTIGPSLAALRQDFTALQKEIQPYLWLAPRLAWLPTYGGDIASAPDLLILADTLLESADQAYQALTPLLQSYQDDALRPDPAQLMDLLKRAQPQLARSRSSLDIAAAARSRIDPARLSPRLRSLLEDVDRILALMDDGLMLTVEIPRALGASAEGPKTYLLLAQNEDELRPTGGFITAASTVLLQDAKIVNISFQNSGYLDNWQRPYPPAPWQLQQYMNSPVLIFRDSNWFTDYPTSALYAEYLYSYISNHSVDGVIAFDQHMLVEVLRVTGPLTLEGESTPITADNAKTFMRSQKTPSPEEQASGVWDNKAFLNQIASALLKKLFSGSVAAQDIAPLLIRMLDERHLMIQVDDPILTDYLVHRNWDGAVRPSDGDFLMVVDSNIGFNKTNAVVQPFLSYDVDLTNLSAPQGQLVVSHQNNASSKVPCLIHSFLDTSTPEMQPFIEKDYPINRCYWDYLRVYVLKDAELLGAKVQAIPAEWTIYQTAVPPQVDILDEEIQGIRGFGAYKVVPGGQSVATNFRFKLPASVVTRLDTGEVVYRLKIQKQPGTLGTPLTLRLHLSNDAVVLQAPKGAVIEGQNILLESALVTDLEYEFIIRIP